jgi:WD40 repeat protein/DNA-binding SARP family transcriptional activator
MGIAVLGPLTVNGRTGSLAPRDRVVLEALALCPGEVVSAERLADALWRDGPPATWSKVVQGTVVRLRKTLGPEAIETVDHGYRLVVRAGDLDAPEFERLVARAREQLTLGEPERASYTVGEALALWRGRPLGDPEGWEPGRSEAERLEELRRDAEELRIEAALQSGRHREVLGEAHRRVEEAPMRERRWELLARAEYQSGQQADALRTLRQVRKVLAAELGLDPGPDLVALEQAILRQDPSLLARSAPPVPSATCPYLGLVPYDVADAEAFYGRDADVEACRNRLDDAGVLAVVGPSGSGKSSLVRAGLTAALLRDGHRVVVITPGAHPMDALTAVPSRGGPPVLVVDQCEEAVSLCEDAEEHARFFSALASHAEAAPLVVALRADRIGDLTAYGGFARLVERGLYLLNPMSAESLRAAIEGPARQTGLRLEPGLVELLVHEVEGRPGALPYLSHALRQTWERREGPVLTLEGYQATGGIRNAVAQSAEQLYEAMSTEQRAMLRDLMLRLVTPSPEGEPVRSRVRRRILSVDSEHDRLLEDLVTARLVTSDDGEVELAHEALARGWPRLRGWLDDDAAGQRILRHLSVTADTWDSMGRPESELYRGTRLAQALDWRAAAQPDLTPNENGFLEASRTLAEQEEQSAAEQARHQARVNRRLRGLLAGAVFLLVVAVVSGTLAVRQANRADDATTAADARRVAAQSQLTGRVDRSLQLAVAAQRLEPSAESRAALLSALSRTPQLLSFTPNHGQPFWRMDVSPDGDQMAVMDQANHVWFYDPESLELLGDYDPFPEGWDLEVGGSSDPMTYSASGDLLAVATLNIRGRVLRLVDTSTFQEVDRQPGGIPSHLYPNDVDLSADGRYLAMTYFDVATAQKDLQYGVYVWDLRRPARPIQNIGLVGDTQYVQLSPDGSLVYTFPGWSSDLPSVVSVFDRASGRKLRSLGTLGQPLVFSPDGSMMAYATDSHDVVLASPSTGRAIRRLTGPQDNIRRVAFSPDGTLVLATGEDRFVTVWSTDTGRRRERIPLGAGLFGDADFSGDGTAVLAAIDSGVHTYDLRGDRRYVRRTVTPGVDTTPGTGSVGFPSPDGTHLAVSTWDIPTQDSKLHVLDVTTGEQTGVSGRGWLGDTDSTHAWSPDGTTLAVVDRDGGLRVVDARSGRVLARRQLEGTGSIEYDDAGRRLLVQVDDGAVLLDARTLEPLNEPVSVPGQQTERLLLGPGDTQAVVITTRDLRGEFDWFGAARQWALVDLDSGDVLKEGSLQHSVNSAALSPDGTRLAVASKDGVEVVNLGTGTIRSPVKLGAETEDEGRHLTYSGDGRLLASNDNTGRVSLWDGRSGALLGTVRPGGVDSAAVFLEDRRTLLIAGWDGAVYEWDTSEEHALDFACRVVGGGLSESEWRAFFGNRPFREVC